jgi:hypothetical protein
MSTPAAVAWRDQGCFFRQLRIKATQQAEAGKLLSEILPHPEPAFVLLT